MRRLRLALILPFLLVLAQHGAVLHELSHAYYSAYTLSAHVSNALPDESVCVTCCGFAPLAHPASGSPPALSILRPTLLETPEPLYTVTRAPAPVPRCRGPPHLSV